MGAVAVPLRRARRELSRPARELGRLGLAALGIAGVSGVVYGLDAVAPTVSLVSLYLFVVVPVALAWGVAYAVVVSVASMLTFNFLFLPPLYTFTLAEPQNWVALAVFVVVAVVVGELAARVRRRAADAEQREREEAFLAEVATSFLGGRSPADELGDLAGQIRVILRAESVRIELGAQRDPPAGESPYELRVADGRIGTLYLREGAEPNLAIRRRFLPALASLLAVAVDRERLAQAALDAEALRRSDAIKTAVLRAVSHDLKSPITAILAAADSLRSGRLELGGEDREALLDAIATESHRLDRLVQDLLDLSRLQAGAAEPMRELWPVEELVAQALDEIGPAADLVSVTIPADLSPVQVDAGQVRRALANLLDNALKFTHPSEGVSVRVNATRREIVIRVVDQGPGILPDELERIFAPFYRASAVSAARGSGLGLAIAKGFVEANGGRIWAESRPGQGSSFAIAFEAAPVPASVGT
jgi:two-component system sensor histidine kinase KdpD